MAGRNNNHDGSCSGGHGCRSVPGQSYSGSGHKSSKVGLCKDLESNIFDFGTATCADLMRATQEKIVQDAASTYGGDIANELKNRVKLVIGALDYSDAIKLKHQARLTLVRTQQANMLWALNQKKTTLSSGTPMDMTAAIELAKVDNEILQLEYEMSQDVEVQLTDKEKGEFHTETKTYTNRINTLKTHREKVFGD